MRKLLFAFLLPLPIFAACAAGPDGEDDFSNDPPLSSEEDVKGDAPADSELEDETKSDAVFPKQFDIVASQTPVQSQGSRGVCSIFATVAQVENVYKKAGMANPDFSEQYLQWSVKFEEGDFTNTEGSSGESNISAVRNFGIVEESAWRYESSPWTTANDPACVSGGENLPTRCYTNGEPPASAQTARKFKVPDSRYLSTRSMKQHITTKGTGVVVGMTFFYQSWNHRRSALPVSSQLWNEGFVTYPNAKDKELSLAKRAGHAILIVGWNDDLEAPMRDETGATIKDGNGNDMMEKGFWMFKNSWGTTSGFGASHDAGAGYGWLSYRYVSEFGSAVVAGTPTLEAATETQCTGGVDDDRDGAIDCADSDCAANPVCEVEPGSFTYTATPNASIPDDNTTGITSSVTASDSGTVASVKVSLNITHPYRGDLTVSLTKGTTTRAFIVEQGGSADNITGEFDVTGFAGTELGGSWTLKVVDGAAQDVGTLNTWALEVVTQ